MDVMGGMGGGGAVVDIEANEYMFTGVFACVWACMAVSMPVHLCICVICPRGNWLATRHGCCSNDAVTTTV